jgi:altronate dehydratase
MNPPDVSGTDTATDPRLLRLDPRDNTLTVLAALQPGETVRVAGKQVRVPKLLPLGHKLAGCDIRAGESVFKYGVPIGSATTFIATGDHVHTHNLKSDYLPTWLHETQDKYFDGHA